MDIAVLSASALGWVPTRSTNKGRKHQMRTLTSIPARKNYSAGENSFDLEKGSYSCWQPAIQPHSSKNGRETGWVSLVPVLHGVSKIKKEHKTLTKVANSFSFSSHRSSLFLSRSSACSLRFAKAWSCCSAACSTLDVADSASSLDACMTVSSPHWRVTKNKRRWLNVSRTTWINVLTSHMLHLFFWKRTEDWTTGRNLQRSIMWDERKSVSSEDSEMYRALRKTVTRFSSSSLDLLYIDS